MTQRTPKACHTSMRRGATVIAILRDGTQVVGKYVERKGRFVFIGGEKLATKNLKSLSYYKENSNE